MSRRKSFIETTWLSCRKQFFRRRKWAEPGVFEGVADRVEA